MDPELLRNFLHRLTGIPLISPGQFPNIYYEELIPSSPETIPVDIARALFQIDNIDDLKEMAFAFPITTVDVSHPELLLVRLAGVEAISAEMPLEWKEPLLIGNHRTTPIDIIMTLYGVDAIAEIAQDIAARHQAADPLLQTILVLFRRLTAISPHAETLDDWETPLITNVALSMPIEIISRILGIPKPDLYSLFRDSGLYNEPGAMDTQIAEIFEVPNFTPEAEVFETHISPVSLLGMDMDKIELAISEWLTIRTIRARPFYGGPNERSRWQSWSNFIKDAALSQEEANAAELMIHDQASNVDFKNLVGDNLLENPFAFYSNLENVIVTFEHEVGVEVPFFGGTIIDWLKNTHPSIKLEELCEALIALGYYDANKYDGADNPDTAEINQLILKSVVIALEKCKKGGLSKKVSVTATQVPQNWRQLKIWKREKKKRHKPLVIIYAPETIKEYKEYRGDHPIFNFVDMVFCNVGIHTAHKGWRVDPDVELLAELIAPYGNRRPDLIAITKRISAKDAPEEEKKRPRNAHRANTKWILDDISELTISRDWDPINVVRANYPGEISEPWLQEILNIVG